MTQVIISGDCISIYARYAQKDICRSITNRRWNPDMKCWEVPLSSASEVISKFPDADIVPEVFAAADALKRIDSLSHQSSGLNMVVGPGLELLPFQTVGVEFLNLCNGNAMIADEPGLGKTIQTLVFLLQHPELRPALIVCPASLKLNWEREAHKWLNENEKIIVSNGSFEPGTINIINYDIIKKYTTELKGLGIKIIVLDESHYLKNIKARRTQLIQTIAATIPHKILLTGTPILNRPVELFTQLNLINPKAWGQFWDFANRYCAAHKNAYGWDYSGSSNIEELNTRLKGFVIRRIKKEVLSELPEKQKTNIELKIDNVSEYKQAERDIIDYINDKKGYSAADKASRAKALVKIETLKQIAAEGKLPGVCDWIDSFLASGEKLVIFAWHDFVINALRLKYSNISVSLTGSNSSEQRQASVDAFQNNPSVKLFIANIQAGGVGITLTASSNVAFVELGWTPSVMTQAEDRVHRIGQKNAVNVYYLLARNTIDDLMCGLLMRKSSVIDAAIDGKAYQEFSMFDELIDSFRKGLR